MPATPAEDRAARQAAMALSIAAALGKPISPEIEDAAYYLFGQRNDLDAARDHAANDSMNLGWSREEAARAAAAGAVLRNYAVATSPARSVKAA